jgi:hypothetical protein
MVISLDLRDKGESANGVSGSYAGIAAEIVNSNSSSHDAP